MDARLRAIQRAWADRQEPLDHQAVYGVVDTTFAVAAMGPRAIDELHACGVADDRIRYLTVPGFKDLGVAARRLFARGCDIVLCCGMAGPEAIDKQCAQDASIGMQMAQQATGKHVLEVIVHMDETDDPQELVRVVDDRVREHARNAHRLMEAPHEMTLRAGTGRRQGFEDVGAIDGA